MIPECVWHEDFYIASASIASKSYLPILLSDKRGVTSEEN